MGINIYNNNEEQFSKVSESLKELPKVNAPDDFEFNLMVKISNGEFTPEVEEKRQSKLLWILAPAALVVTTLILFVTFSKSELEQKLNPIQNQGSIYAGKVADPAAKKKLTVIPAEKQNAKKKVQNQTSNPLPDENFYPDPNLFVKDYSYSPLSKEGSYNLDNLMQGRKDQNLTTVMNKRSGYPDEWLLKAESQKNSLKEKNAVRDSLKKMIYGNDSLKLKKNIKR